MVNNYESNDYSKENDKTREIRFLKGALLLIGIILLIKYLN